MMAASVLEAYPCSLSVGLGQDREGRRPIPELTAMIWKRPRVRRCAVNALLTQKGANGIDGDRRPP
jgi:hypothetical protein